VLVVALAPVLPAGPALVVALISRLWMMLVELAGAAVAHLVARRSAAPGPGPDVGQAETARPGAESPHPGHAGAPPSGAQPSDPGHTEAPSSGAQPPATGHAKTPPPGGGTPGGGA
jgi:hypothetical protein